MSDDALNPSSPEATGELTTKEPLTVRGLDRVLAIQRPLVLAHLHSVRLRHRDATPAEIIRILERRYLAAVTAGGAAVGATAVVPGIGTGVSLTLSGVETAGFVESTALFAQSVAEVHGMPVQDPERARTLVMTLMLGREGADLIRQFAGQASGRGGSRSGYWGELVTKSLPRAAVGPLADRVKSMFLAHFAKQGSASFFGKALPFGVGAAVGGAGNHLLGRRVLRTSRLAFGPAPATLPAELEPQPGAVTIERRLLNGAKRAGSAVSAASGAAVHGVRAGGTKLSTTVSRVSDGLRRRSPEDSPSTDGQ